MAIIKNLLDKTLRSDENFPRAWFCLQNTPHSSEGMYPAHLLYRRLVKNPLLHQLSDRYDETARGGALHANREKKMKKKNENKNSVDTNPLEVKVGMHVLLQGVIPSFGI